MVYLNEEQQNDLETNGCVILASPDGEFNLVVAAEVITLQGDTTISEDKLSGASYSLQADLKDDTLLTIKSFSVVGPGMPSKCWLIKTNKILFGSHRLYFTAGSNGCYVDKDSPEMFWLRKNGTSLNLITHEDAIKMKVQLPAARH